MRFRQLFDVFSRRQAQNPKPVAPLTPEFRNRVIMLCAETFGSGRDSYPNNFWDEIHDKLRYLVGRPQLTQDRYVNTRFDDTTTFLLQCTDAHMLDFIEFIFQTQNYWHQTEDKTVLITSLNHIFLADDLPYAITGFVWETRKQFFYGTERDAQVIVSYPKVIRRDDQVTHVWTIEPTLTLLKEEHFTSANKEFLEALEDYRKGNYGDCLTKCCSAFESTMKIICDRKKWTPQNDQARGLLLTILQESGLEQNYFEQPLLNIATLRNKLSKAHGAGTQQRQVPQHVAKYAINATAAAILLLVEECG